MKLLSHLRSLSSTPLLPQKVNSSGLLPGLPPARVITYRLRRRHVALFVIGTLSLGLTVVQMMTSAHSPTQVDGYSHENSSSSYVVEETLLNHTSSQDTVVVESSNITAVASHSPWVLGPPTQKFRENLRSDRKYITSWYGAGWSTCGHILSLRNNSLTLAFYR